MDGVKIQINSLEALERLIGGDTSMEVELRASIVQDFAKRHLKSIAADEVAKVEVGLKEQITKEYSAAVTRATKWPQNFILTDDLKRRIEQSINKIVGDYALSYIGTIVLTPSFIHTIQEKVDNTVTALVEKLIRDTVSTRVKDAFNQAMAAAKEKI